LARSIFLGKVRKDAQADIPVRFLCMQATLDKRMWNFIRVQCGP